MELTKQEIVDALTLAMEKIEASGASITLTDALIICGDLRDAIGNPVEYNRICRAEVVRQRLVQIPYDPRFKH